MTNLYAWNTARAGSIAHPNVAGRAYSTLQGRADFLACSTNFIGNAPTDFLDQSDAAHPAGFPIMTNI
uniref:Uncharacterized protein n=1 Tax=Candidatus Kentrum sp. FM TaxID=2126340 RepID=A0A450TGV8_9GAMM|nr:MAG: hypothetical protein BECKFM1743A_GA0114220_104143 [Candidatus Kentron sp. FM]